MEGTVPLCFALVKPCLESCIQLWAPQDKKGTGLLQWIQRRDMKMVRGTEHLSCEESLRGGTVHPEKGSGDTFLLPFILKEGLWERQRKTFYQGLQ